MVACRQRDFKRDQIPPASASEATSLHRDVEILRMAGATVDEASITVRQSVRALLLIGLWLRSHPVSRVLLPGANVAPKPAFATRQHSLPMRLLPTETMGLFGPIAVATSVQDEPVYVQPDVNRIDTRAARNGNADLHARTSRKRPIEAA